MSWSIVVTTESIKGAYESKITEGKVAELLWKEDITLSFAVAGLKLGIFCEKERDSSLEETARLNVVGYSN